MSDQTDPLAEALDIETVELAALRSRVAQLEREKLARGDIDKRLAERDAEIVRLEREMDALGKFTTHEPPDWMRAPVGSTTHRGIPWLMLSDLHLDEVVFPDQMNGMNAYNREIALMRLEATAQGFVQVWRDYHRNITYDGVVVALGGDIFSGDIHEELKETNADTLLGSVDYWIDPLAAVLRLIADEFGAVHVPVVPGNHGRTTRKPRAKFRARSNFDWFIGAQLARVFAKDDRITFDVSESADCLVDCYGRKVMVTHGDQASGGAGIGGIWPPLMRLDARKRQRQEAVQQGYELMVMGHWHTLVFGPQWIVNGSLKGYDEYAFTSNFGFEEPQQASWLMTPEHGKTFTAPIFSQDREAEGW